MLPVTLVEYGDYECSYCAQAYIIIKEAQAPDMAISAGVELILTLLMITYGLNRIFRHAQLVTFWIIFNFRNPGPSPFF